MFSTDDLVFLKYRPRLYRHMALLTIGAGAGALLVASPENYEYGKILSRELVFALGLVGLVGALRGVVITCLEIRRGAVAVRITNERLYDMTGGRTKRETESVRWRRVVSMEQRPEATRTLLVLRTIDGNDLEIELTMLSPADGSRLMEEVRKRLEYR